MREGILRLGNEQLAEVGAAALSVREIARGLGVASSAIYRHVSSRDELLTLLLVSAYTDIADSVLEQIDPRASSASRLAQLTGGVRGWAVRHPARWALAYGSPVPGYAAPAEQTTGPGTRVMAAFLALLAEGNAPESLASPKSSVSDALAAELASGAEELGVAADPALAAAAVEAWTGLIGLVSAEVFGQLGRELAQHGAELLERWTTAVATRFGLA